VKTVFFVKTLWYAASLFLSTFGGFKKSRVLMTGVSPVNKTCKHTFKAENKHLVCQMHRYRKSQNRLLKVCCVPATSTGLPTVSFFFSFLFFVAVANYSTNKANKAGGMRH
jgi:hypothetical protein